MELIDKNELLEKIEELEAQNNCGTSDFIEAKRIAFRQVKQALDSLKVKEVDLEKEMGKYLDVNNIEYGFQVKLFDFAKHFFELGLKANNLWHDAQGDDLPDIDREVIVLCDNWKVCYGHRPNPKGWVGRDIVTNEVTHYTPQTYDKGGWNIPDVKWWLDVEIPNWEEQ